MHDDAGTSNDHKVLAEVVRDFAAANERILSLPREPGMR
jgi:hypothetical protein